MARQLVLACGNSLRGDDGVGWKIAEALEIDPLLRGIEVVIAQQWTPEMAEQISGADTVIFVDCSAVSFPGEVLAFPVKAARSTTGSLTHNATPGTLLALSLELYGTAPQRAFAVTVGGKSFELTEQLSEPVEMAVALAVRTIRQLL